MNETLLSLLVFAGGVVAGLSWSFVLAHRVSRRDNRAYRQELRIMMTFLDRHGLLEPFNRFAEQREQQWEKKTAP